MIHPRAIAVSPLVRIRLRLDIPEIEPFAAPIPDRLRPIVRIRYRFAGLWLQAPHDSDRASSPVSQSFALDG